MRRTTIVFIPPREQAGAAASIPVLQSPRRQSTAGTVDLKLAAEMDDDVISEELNRLHMMKEQQDQHRAQQANRQLLWSEKSVNTTESLETPSLQMYHYQYDQNTETRPSHEASTSTSAQGISSSYGEFVDYQQIVNDGSINIQESGKKNALHILEKEKIIPVKDTNEPPPPGYQRVKVRKKKRRKLPKDQSTLPEIMLSSADPKLISEKPADVKNEKYKINVIRRHAASSDLPYTEIRPSIPQPEEWYEGDISTQIRKVEDFKLLKCHNTIPELLLLAHQPKHHYERKASRDTSSSSNSTAVESTEKTRVCQEYPRVLYGKVTEPIPAAISENLPASSSKTDNDGAMYENRCYDYSLLEEDADGRPLVVKHHHGRELTKNDYIKPTQPSVLDGKTYHREALKVSESVPWKASMLSQEPSAFAASTTKPETEPERYNICSSVYQSNGDEKLHYKAVKVDYALGSDSDGISRNAERTAKQLQGQTVYDNRTSADKSVPQDYMSNVQDTRMSLCEGIPYKHHRIPKRKKKPSPNADDSKQSVTSQISNETFISDNRKTEVEMRRNHGKVEYQWLDSHEALVFKRPTSSLDKDDGISQRLRLREMAVPLNIVITTKADTSMVHQPYECAVAEYDDAVVTALECFPHELVAEPDLSSVFWPYCLAHGEVHIQQVNSIGEHRVQHLDSILFVQSSVSTVIINYLSVKRNMYCFARMATYSGHAYERVEKMRALSTAAVPICHSQIHKVSYKFECPDRKELMIHELPGKGLRRLTQHHARSKTDHRDLQNVSLKQEDLILEQAGVTGAGFKRHGISVIDDKRRPQVAFQRTPEVVAEETDMFIYQYAKKKIKRHTSLAMEDPPLTVEMISHVGLNALSYIQANESETSLLDLQIQEQALGIFQRVSLDNAQCIEDELENIATVSAVHTYHRHSEELDKSPVLMVSEDVYVDSKRKLAAANVERPSRGSFYTLAMNLSSSSSDSEENNKSAEAGRETATVIDEQREPIIPSSSYVVQDNTRHHQKSSKLLHANVHTKTSSHNADQTSSMHQNQASPWSVQSFDMVHIAEPDVKVSKGHSSKKMGAERHDEVTSKEAKTSRKISEYPIVEETSSAVEPEQHTAAAAKKQKKKVKKKDRHKKEQLETAPLSSEDEAHSRRIIRAQPDTGKTIAAKRKLIN